LDEIRDILEIYDRGELPCGEVKHHLEAKVEEIDRQIQALKTLKSELKGLLSGWEDRPSRDRISQTICPNIQW
jgi:DNA-binding transcriptional MerR regulator